ncbi:MAG: AraC family transcriptional regulator [Acidobacteriota bacterium]
MPLSASSSLIGFGLAAFLAALLWFDRERRSESRILAALLAVHAVGFLLRYAFVSGSAFVAYLPFLVFPVMSLHGPLVNDFVRRSLFGPPPAGPRRFAILIAPALCALVFGFYFFSIADFRDRDAVLAQSGPIAQFTRTMFLMVGIYCAAFWLRALAALRTYRQRYEANFSNLDSLRLDFLKAFVGFVGAVYASHTAKPVISTLFDLRLPVTALEGLILLGLTYLVLYYLVRRPQIFSLSAETPEVPVAPTADRPDLTEDKAAEVPAAGSNSSAAEAAEAAEAVGAVGATAAADAPGPATTATKDGAKYARQNLDGEARRALLQRIQTHMEKDRPHLDGELALADLAEAVEIPKHHFSMAINIELGQNFFQFVNGYRVAEARRLLADPSLADENVLSIAFRAGFQSKAAFNKVFKKTTGQTPGQYRAAASS